MKKLFLMACAAALTLNANAQSAKWDASMLPADFNAGIEAGFGNVWDTYLATPADYTLCECEGFRAYFELPTLLGPGNNKYSGASYGMKPLMGSNNTGRDGIDPLYFIEGLTNNDYVRTNSDDTHGTTYTDAIVTLKVASEAEGGSYGMITITYNRGGNLSAMYVVDQTAKNGEGMMVLQSRTRCPDENVQDHVAKFGVEPGHTYYIVASEKQSVELYGLRFDAVVSDEYETLNTTENFPVYWDAAMLPADFNAGIEAGFGNVWDTYLATPADYTLCEGEGFRAYFELPTLLGPGNGGYSGKDYGMKPLMGSNNTGRDGIDPLFFIEGLTNNDYVRTNSDNTHGTTYTDAIVTIKVAAEADGGQYGKVAINYNRGGNLSAMYVVDQTAKNGEGMMVLQSRTRCSDESVKTHTAQFGVEPGHTYYIVSSEKQSVELYSIGFCPASSEVYGAGSTTGIENIETSTVATPTTGKIYTIDGRYVGKDKAALVKGLYIMDGKKFVVK